jgi:hypothetical protein
MKQKPYEYGRSPNPKNWHEAADAIRSISKSKSARKTNPIEDKLNTIEQLLKDHK